MSKIAVISSILEDARDCQEEFNDVVASFRGSIIGRMGLPFAKNLSVISIALTGDKKEINKLTEKLENIDGVTVNTAIARKEV